MSASDFEERVMTIPLRDVAAGSATDAADRAMSLVRKHLAKHFSVPEAAVRLDPSINEVVWSQSRGNIPGKIRVRAARFEEDGEGVVEAEVAE